MAELKKTSFDVAAFLANAGLGRRIVQLKPKSIFFSQGRSADSIFYLQKGRAKLTVVSKKGKEATPSRFSPRGTSLERSHLQPSVGSVWRLRLPSPPVPRSR